MNGFELGWLACRDCQLAHPVGTPAHGLPSELQDELTAAVAAFLNAHGGHNVTHVHRDDDCAVLSTRPLWDPMATVSMEVTDGSRRFVLTAERNSVDEPRTYRIVPGRLHEAHPAAVEIDAGDVRRSLDRAFYPHVLRPSKIDRFVRTLSELVGHLEPCTLDVAFDDANDPAVSIAALPDTVCCELSQRCADIFDPPELARVLAFLNDNRSESGALAVRIRREPSFAPTELQ
jgi:hypothetical protein